MILVKSNSYLVFVCFLYRWNLQQGDEPAGSGFSTERERLPVSVGVYVVESIYVCVWGAAERREDCLPAVCVGAIVFLCLSWCECVSSLL